MRNDNFLVIPEKWRKKFDKFRSKLSYDLIYCRESYDKKDCIIVATINNQLYVLRMFLVGNKVKCSVDVEEFIDDLKPKLTEKQKG